MTEHIAEALSHRRRPARRQLATAAASSNGVASPVASRSAPKRLVERGIFLSLAAGLAVLAGVSWRDIGFAVLFPVYLWAVNKWRFNDNAAAREAAAADPSLPMTLYEGASLCRPFSDQTAFPPARPPANSIHKRCARALPGHCSLR